MPASSTEAVENIYSAPCLGGDKCGKDAIAASPQLQPSQSPPYGTYYCWFLGFGFWSVLLWFLDDAEGEDRRDERR